MEAESRTWTVRCPKCGYERSLWDAGGLQHKAVGTSYWFTRCPNCGQRSWNKVYWPQGITKAEVYAKAAAAPGMAALSDRPPWLLWVLATIVWLGLILAAVALFGFVLSWLIHH